MSTESPSAPSEDAAASPRAAIIRQSLSISLAVVPFGIAFGVAVRQGGMTVLDAMGFAVLVFTGSAQFAAVSVLADGGTAAAAIVSGLLLNLRSLAFGLVMAPALRGPVWKRALLSHLMIDESTAVGSAQTERHWQRYGFVLCGVMLFSFWNVAILAGASILGGADDLIRTLGIDATVPAAFLALLWPRLADPEQRAVAAVGAVIAIAVAPVVPPGLPIILAAAAVVIVRPWEHRPPAEPEAGVVA
ncbi:MAG: AzlC family ABC transporter permease [Actinomycetota bacterium]